MMQQGCQAFMARLGSSNEESIELASIPMVLEFIDVFPDTLLIIPPPREVEFTIDVAHGIEPIS